MTAEIWRDVPQWDGLYQVSNRGRVRSLPRTTYRATTHSPYRVAGRVLRPNASGSVNLSRPGARRSIVAHSIAAELFGDTDIKLQHAATGSTAT